MTTLVVEPAAGPLQGRLRPPSDKSISHRAAIFALLAEGESRVQNFLQADDTLATLNVCQRLGAEVQHQDGQLLIRGRGLSNLEPPTNELDCGNSGTAMRLLSGVLAGQRFSSVLTGDKSLSKRPMSRVIQPLRQMGAKIEAEDGHAPIKFQAMESPLLNQRFDLAVASAQVKSCLLLAALNGQGTQRIHEPGPSRDHSERMLRAAGIKIGKDSEGWLSLEGSCQKLQPLDLSIPADPSSAAFLMAAALLVPGSEIQLDEVGINPTRIGLFDAFQAMGAELGELESEHSSLEPLTNLQVRSQALQGIDVPIEWIPRMIDELPILLTTAVFAQGLTRVRGAAELRVKESDRLAAMAAGFEALGIEYRLYEDGMDVPGQGGSAQIRGGEVDAQGDHRIAMSFAVLALRAQQPVRIHNAEMIATSYPDFPRHLQSLGAEASFQ